ncbi:CCR4-NOT transcription complex subunit 3-like [Dendronephthya gigantea]|uniref:CCR4-NOT transcription complex subunit 3-like n=1 Tax=Dendronephthya gigantea TaxID=151771 RepID=UPI0010690FCD|nr:CCR4-NOT transcription complex subunit 3-like [Dendronephthya gigantea]
MADKRKLQAEIDRCLKKITEGVETFEDIWQKVHNAANANQKEKYEADLKKEIKKLQRLRDQIKTWIASNDIKDKQVLVDKRKLIETQMERFKVVERETKTKAYSKEGLGLATKIDPATKEKEEFRNWLTESIDRLNVQVDQIESELEALNSAPKKRKADKERLERIEELNRFIGQHNYHVKQLERILRMLDNSTISPADMNNLQDDMEFYIENSMQPDFEENEYMYNDLLLDDADPDSANNLATSPTDNEEEFSYQKDNMVNSIPPNSPTTLTNNYNNKISAQNSPRKNSKGSCSTAPPTVNNIGNGSPVTKVPTTPKINTSNSGNGSNRGSSTLPPKTVNTTIVNSDHPTSEVKPPVTPPPISGYAGVVGGNNHNPAAPAPLTPNDVIAKNTTPSNKRAAPPVVVGHNSNPEHTDSDSQQQQQQQNDVNDLITSLSSLSMPSSVPLSTTTMVNSLPQPSLPAVSCQPSLDTTTSELPAVSSPSHHTSTSTNIANSFTASGQTTNSASVSSTVPSTTLLGDVNDCLEDTSPSHGPLSMSVPTQNEISRTLLENDDIADVNQRENDDRPQIMQPASLGPPQVLNSLNTLKTMAAQAVAHAGVDNNSSLPKQLGNLPNRVLFESAATTAGQERREPETHTAHLQPLLGVAPLGPVPLNKDKVYQLALVEPAFHHLPFPSDSERVRPYLPRTPYPTAGHHHHQMPPHLDSIDFFQRLSTETLFFIFYYQEGTRAQYLAAKALKKQSWRFHTKYMMWFQRHEEPKAITDEYEQGTYIYFDYEKWMQRKKDGFTFEYRYLEDKDLP